MESKMLKRLMLTLVAVICAPLACTAEEAGKAYIEGVDYDLITPAIHTASPGKIEVVEFFWYGCSHCYHFEPLVQPWKMGLPGDVEFRGSPAIWSKPMELHARTFYAAKALGVLDTMHPVLFRAMNEDHKKLASQKEIAELFAANGVEPAAFNEAFDSFGVGSQVRQANATARAAKITGTPSLMVNGKYLISAGKAGGQAGMLEVADYLIDKERAAAKAREEASAAPAE
jgi:thiol:disulfide interchange protein DsbA